MSTEGPTEVSLKNRLQEFLAYRGETKDDRALQEELNFLSPETLSEIVDVIEHISKSETASYLLEVFRDVDKYPQPADASVSRGELIDHLSRANSSRAQAMVLIAWFSFDDIRQSVPGDASEAAFDYQITKSDLEAWGKKL